MCDASPSESPEEEEDIDSPGPDRGPFKTQAVPQELSSPRDDEMLGNPRKRTQTLPTFNCPLTGMAAKAEALNRWSRIQEGNEEKSGTLSEDIFKIFDLKSSGLFLGGSPLNKEGDNRLMARRGSDNTGSSSAEPQKLESESQPVRVLSREKSVDTVMMSGSVQQADSRSEKKEEPQQSVERWD